MVHPISYTLSTDTIQAYTGRTLSLKVHLNELSELFVKITTLNEVKYYKTKQKLQAIKNNKLFRGLMCSLRKISI